VTVAAPAAAAVVVAAAAEVAALDVADARHSGAAAVLAAVSPH